MLLGADYPFLDVMWSMLVFFMWIIWIWILVMILSDVFRRRDIGGASKVLWTIFVIIAPFLGVFIYLLVNHDSMAERQAQQVQAQRSQMDDYVRSVASGGGAAEIEKAQSLLSSGAITQAEFETLKAKALA